MKEKIINQFKKKNSYFPYLAIITLASFFTVAIEVFWSSEEKSSQNLRGERQKTADTYIPLGYVLVPIEISNHEALHSLLGSHGVVDLFLPPKDKNSKPFRLARQIKLLRAPLNPHRFAVLSPEQDSAKFVRINQPLFAVVKNPKHNTPIKKVEERKHKRRIYFEDQEN